MSDLKFVKVHTADGVQVDLPIEIATKCLLLKTSFIDEGYDEDEDPIPLHDVTETVLKKVI